MRPFKVVSDGPHRIIETASLPGQKVYELRTPSGTDSHPVVIRPVDTRPDDAIDRGDRAQPTLREDGDD